MKVEDLKLALLSVPDDYDVVDYYTRLVIESTELNSHKKTFELITEDD
jgi:hypothetical protein